MGIVANTVPCAGTVPLPLPPLVYSEHGVDEGVVAPADAIPEPATIPPIVYSATATPDGGNSPVTGGPQPTGPQYYADRSADPLNTVVQQPDGQAPTVGADGLPLGPTTPTAPPNTTTWLTNLTEQTVLTEPF